MEHLVARLLQMYEDGRLTRRQLIHSLALAGAAAFSRSLDAQGARKGFRTLNINHISYQVADFRRTRDFYRDLMGMAVTDEQATECTFGLPDGSRFIVRNAPQEVKPPRVDHIAFLIENWDTDRVKAELDRRGLAARLDPAVSAGRGSFHVADPDGYDLQIEGMLKPGDSLLKK